MQRCDSFKWSSCLYCISRLRLERQMHDLGKVHPYRRHRNYQEYLYRQVRRCDLSKLPRYSYPIISVLPVGVQHGNTVNNTVGWCLYPRRDPQNRFDQSWFVSCLYEQSNSFRLSAPLISWSYKLLHMEAFWTDSDFREGGNHTFGRRRTSSNDHFINFRLMQQRLLPPPALPFLLVRTTWSCYCFSIVRTILTSHRWFGCLHNSCLYWLWFVQSRKCCFDRITFEDRLGQMHSHWISFKRFDKSKFMQRCDSFKWSTSLSRSCTLYMVFWQMHDSGRGWRYDFEYLSLQIRLCDLSKLLRSYSFISILPVVVRRDIRYTF